MRDEARVRRIDLQGLRAEELVDLAELTVGARLGTAGAERLHAHTGGHPMHARALLEELGSTALDTVQGVLPAPRSLATVVIAKVALPMSAEDLVTALAVLGSSAALSVAAAVGAAALLLSALEAAIGAGLVEQSFGGDVRFAHPLVRGAIYTDISPTWLGANLHLAAASVTSGLVALDDLAVRSDRRTGAGPCRRARDPRPRGAQRRKGGARGEALRRRSSAVGRRCAP